MNTRKTAGTPAPSPAPAADLLTPVTEVQPPAKLSKLQVAMNKVSDSVTSIQKLGSDIDELETTGGPKVVFTVATKEGYRQADGVRKKARELRLNVQRMQKEGIALLNGLKKEVNELMDPTIARLDAIETNAKGQIEAEDRKEDDRKQRHKDAIAAIRLLAEGAATMSSADIDRRRTSVAAIVVDDSYEEFLKEAVTVKAAVQDILVEAHAAAVKREEDERRQAMQDAAREKIAHYKGLAESVDGTGLDNVREVLRITREARHTAEEFGDMPEFVDMARDKAVDALEAMVKALEAPAPAPAPAEPQEAPDEGDPDPTMIVGDDTPDLFGEPGAIEREIHGGVDLMADEDPFSKPVVRAPAPTPLSPSGRMSIPARRPTGGYAPAPTPAPTAAPQVPMTTDPTGITVNEVPDLLKAAQDFITTVQEGPRGEANLPDEYRPAYDSLKEVVNLLSEFPPTE